MATTAMSMNDYRRNNDLMGAYERYQKTNKVWRERWWALVEEIYHASKEWAEKYILNTAERILEKIMKKRGRPRKFFLSDVMTFNVEAEGCGAYIVQHFDADGQPLWIKPGKADNAKKRMEQHFKSDYKGQAMSGVCLAWYPCKNKNHALSVENVIRDYFEQKGFFLLGQDRFPDLTEITEEDYEIINRNISYVNKAFGA